MIATAKAVRRIVDLRQIFMLMNRVSFARIKGDNCSPQVLLYTVDIPAAFHLRFFAVNS